MPGATDETISRLTRTSGVVLAGLLSTIALGQTLRQIAKFDVPGPDGKRFDYLTIDNDDHLHAVRC